MIMPPFTYVAQPATTGTRSPDEDSHPKPSSVGQAMLTTPVSNVAQLVAAGTRALHEDRRPKPSSVGQAMLTTLVGAVAPLAAAGTRALDEDTRPRPSSVGQASVGQAMLTTLISAADGRDDDGGGDPDLLTVAFLDPKSGCWKAAADVEASLAHLATIRTRAIKELALGSKDAAAALSTSVSMRGKTASSAGRK